MSTDNSAKKSKKGRPEIDSEAVNVRLTRDLIEHLDNFRRHQPDLPGRPEAIRRILAERLGQPASMKFMNRAREHYGLPPLAGDDKT